MKDCKILVAILVFCFLCVFSLSIAGAAPKVGEKAPYFELPSLSGKVFKIMDVDKPFVAVCFFAPFSKASEASLSTLQDLRTKYGDDQLFVLAISKSPRSKVAEFVSQKGIKVEVLIDDAGVSKEGKIDEAENDFKMLTKLPGEGQVLGKEGLAHVYWLKGDKKKAWEVANDVTDRSSVHVIKGDILYSEGKKDAALNEYSSATKKKGFAFQVATPYNKLGRVYAKNDNFDRAGKLFEKALEVDPYSIEALSNKGVIYEKQGKWGKAHKVYKKAYKLNPRDEISLMLLKRAEEMLELAKDAKRAERIDRLVKELVKRYKENKASQKVVDEWTSRPLVLAFLAVDEKGILTERAGIPEILVNYLSAELANTGRVKVVERALLDKLLAELNLGSSELADPNTTLRLGRILAAKLLASGVLINQPRNAFLSLRMIDSETSAIPIAYSKTVNLSSIDRVIERVSSELLREIVSKYPLQGFVIQQEGNQVLINLGETQGVKKRMRFALLEGGGIIEFKGKKLRRKLVKVGEIEVSSVEPDVSYAKIINVQGQIKSEMKIREIPNSGGKI